MKPAFLLLFFISNFFFVCAQDIYEAHLTRDFRYTENPDYVYVRLFKPYYGVWAFTDYDRKKTIIQTGFFTDSTFAKQTGPNKFYEFGKKIYEGNFNEGIRVGWWYFYNKKEMLTDSLYYVIPSPKKKDTDTAGKKVILVSSQHLRDTSALFDKVETEAEFKTGTDGWRKHLMKTLSFPDLATRVLPSGQRTSIVQFIVCTDGMVCDLQVVQSTHPLLDLEAVNAIRKGGNWNPAFQNGKNVKAYRKQPITFVLD